MDRFYVAALDIRPGSEVRLPPDEAHHLRVKRLRPGDRVRLFDGRGRDATAEVERLDTRTAILRIVSADVPPAETAVRVTVGISLPKGKRTQIFFEKAT